MTTPKRTAKVATGARRNVDRRADPSVRLGAAGTAAGRVNRDRVVALEDMSDAQKRIAAAGSAEPTVPVPDLPKDELKDYFLKRIIAARAARDSRDH